ncbi:uncharacterized protein LOC18767050 [Prunus persica]|uniref:uncharacterized protein LOC18767050 n=1 Tax=Prunus persica TaxID=3760 RepID=UPI0009AB454F|nr:uncharacterized protein LOC18767050 [Prunus persica]
MTCPSVCPASGQLGLVHVLGGLGNTHQSYDSKRLSKSAYQQDHNQSQRSGSPKATSVEWGFLLTGLCLEILSLAFDQASSPSKPQYALFGMILAIAAVLICIWELIYKGKRERVVLRQWGRLWWFYYPHSQHRLFGTLPDFYGLVGGIS